MRKLEAAVEADVEEMEAFIMPTQSAKRVQVRQLLYKNISKCHWLPKTED